MVISQTEDRKRWATNKEINNNQWDVIRNVSIVKISFSILFVQHSSMISPSFMATKIQKKHVKTSYRRTKQKMKIDNGIFSTVCCVSTVSLVFNFIFFLLFCRKSKKILLTKFMISYTLVDNFHLSLSLSGR